MQRLEKTKNEKIKLQRQMHLLTDRFDTLKKHYLQLRNRQLDLQQKRLAAEHEHKEISTANLPESAHSIILQRRQQRKFSILNQFKYRQTQLLQEYKTRLLAVQMEMLNKAEQQSRDLKLVL